MNRLKEIYEGKGNHSVSSLEQMVEERDERLLEARVQIQHLKELIIELTKDNP